MVYTILISIVFIAEIIIAVTILQTLRKLDKKILELNKTIIESHSSIKEISILARKISEQWQILTTDFIEKVKTNGESIFFKNLSKLLISALALKLNFKIINKIRKSKITKTIAKGWTIIESMV